LDGVDLELRRGEVHGLVGRNGSGKSTLIKILSGFHEPDPGARLVIGGVEVPLPLVSAEASHHGLAFVHQDLGLLPDMTVLENVRIGRFTTSAGWRIKWRAERRLVAEALERFGVDVSPDMLVRDLREVDRALVAIVRGFLDLAERDHGILVLDEPTAYLPRDSVDQLFETIRSVAQAGTTVMFVSHRLPEVMDLTDRSTVLRDGIVVDTLVTSETTETQLIELILGGELEDFYPEAHAVTKELVMSVRGLNGPVVSDVDVELHRGEIVGLTGIAGAGYDEVPYLLFGASPAHSGEVTIKGVTSPASSMTPLSAMEAGMALLPADRPRTSGVGDFSITQNVSLPVLGSFFRSGRLRHGDERSRVQQLLHDYTVRPPTPDSLLGQLSGGNQQKALLAKWLQREPPVLLLHEPTQGVDVGAKADVFERLKEAADAGSAVLYCSAEYEDLAQMCDRVMVFQHGRVVAELSGAELTEDRLVEQCYREDLHE
jgi:ribose transport system ATP-binding protein